MATTPIKLTEPLVCGSDDEGVEIVGGDLDESFVIIQTYEEEACARLQKRLNILHTELDVANESNAKLTQEKRQLAEQQEQTAAHLSNAQAELAAVCEARDALAEELHTMRVTLARVQAEKDALGKASEGMQAAEQSAERLAQELQATQAAVRAITEVAEASATENLALTERLESTQSQYTRTLVAIKQLLEMPQDTAMDEMAPAAARRIAELRSERDNAVGAHEEIAAQLTEREALLREVMQQHDADRKALVEALQSASQAAEAAEATAARAADEAARVADEAARVADEAAAPTRPSLVYENFEDGDIALFLPTDREGVYVAFSPNSPNHFLADETMAILEGRNDPYYLCEIVSISTDIASPDNDPYNVGTDVPFSIVVAVPIA